LTIGIRKRLTDDETIDSFSPESADSIFQVGGAENAEIAGVL
jgi:hypothetical protein